MSGDSSSRAVPVRRTPASTVHTSSSGGSSSAGARPTNHVRCSSCQNNVFTSPGQTLGSARESSDTGSGEAEINSEQETSLDHTVHNTSGIDVSTTAQEILQAGDEDVLQKQITELIKRYAYTSCCEYVPSTRTKQLTIFSTPTRCEVIQTNIPGTNGYWKSAFHEFEASSQQQSHRG